MSGLIVFVSTPTNNYPIELSPNATVQDIIDKMPDKDVPPTNKRIYYQDVVQPESEMLADLGICNESTIEYRPYTTLKVTDDDIKEHVKKCIGGDPKYQAGAEWDISYWDTSKVEDMDYIFHEAKEFNQPLNWDTSNVEHMAGMFYGAIHFNQPLNWDTSKVEDMNKMFCEADEFNQPLNWNTSKVINMGSMFYEAFAFNQPLNWDTSNVENMNKMFCEALAFNQPLNWDTPKVGNNNYEMFVGSSGFIREWYWRRDSDSDSDSGSDSDSDIDS